ncbi:MAG TPA: sulfatase-like hydrolase/transferase [Agriterribacter sp.]|nr:sulfatase-like hydrolase/transferase [Agriterribacter sp.]
MYSKSNPVDYNYKDAKHHGFDSTLQPNIILIIGESHRAEALEGFGNSFVKTPNLRKLASEGTVFNNFFVTTAICAASRASILCGQSADTHGISDFSTDFTKNAFANTFPMQLKKAGYTLAWIGFFGIGKNPPKNDFDFWRPDIPWMKDGKHNIDITVETANDFIDNSGNGAPFFMCVNFKAAHEIDPTNSVPAHYVVQDRFKGLYNNIKVREPETADPKYWDELPDFFKDEQNIARKRWEGFFSTKELFQKNSKDYYRLITGLDDAVGKVRSKLIESGLDKNTIIIYTTDHGFSLGEHGLMGKWYPFNVSMHIPFILYDPRNAELAGTRFSEFALNIDIAPTILSLSGLNIPKEMEGQNLIEAISGHIKPRDFFIYEHSFLGAPHLFKTKAIVSKRYKYIVYTENGYEQLFDIIGDPDESVNLVNSKRHHRELQAMRSLYNKNVIVH